MKQKIATALFLTLIIVAGSLSKLSAQNNGSSGSFEVKSINGIITTVYSLISGDAGDRDWEKFNSLFYPGAKFISVKRDVNGKEIYFEGSVDEYIEIIKPLLKENTYYEQETARSIQESDNIAQVFSLFESILFEDGTPRNQKGANSFQLIYKDGRWWITNVLFNSEPRAF